MNAIITTLGGMFRNTTMRVILGAAIAGIGTASTARAHDDVHVDLDLRHGHAEIETRYFMPPVIEERETRVWVEPAYQTIPGPRVWVEPVYRTVVDHVLREAVVRDDAIQVFVPATFEVRDVVHGHHVSRERVFIAAHYEGRIQHVVVVAAHDEEVARQELVCEGHWQTNDQQVLVTPRHWETRIERVPVIEGHFVERPLIRIH